MNESESKFTQQLEKLDDRTRIVPILGRAEGATRSASSIYDDAYGVMRGELYNTGPGNQAWAAKSND